MFSRTSRLSAARLQALDCSLATITFAPDGTILDANGNFLSVTGYRLEELVGQHHRLFMDPQEAAGRDYAAFWEAMRRGEAQQGEFCRRAKGGREIWLHATYTPVRSSGGHVRQIVKVATDITDEKLARSDVSGQIEAINRSQGVIHFALDGTILDANPLFLSVVGYSLDEVRGKHHRMFMGERERQSIEYANFWKRLAAGEFIAGEFKRVDRHGKERWLQATYNPIFDMHGRPFKVVKYATEITDAKLRSADMAGQMEAISRAQAVIHFDLDGTILDANDNFLRAMGYSLAEVKGKHHRMFVPPAQAASREYEQFWEKLRRGEFASAVYQRIGKGGREVWIQGNYNPVFDMNGRPFKVVKYATDVTHSMAVRTRAVQAAEDTLLKVQTVAAAAEEMAATANAIADQMQRSRTSVENIQAETASAESSTASLRQAARAMDGVVQLITSIAEQINLLALNATIEAARAGEAGRGFAVVAGEVKTLASQTTAATAKISTEIAAMQSVSDNVGSALSAISGAVTQMQSFVAQAADSVDQQSSATAEISANMQIAAAGVESIATNLDEWVVGVEERRSDPRARVSLRAAIHVPGRDRAVEGIVMNLSRGGAKVGVDGHLVPDQFRMLIEGETTERVCQVVRRNATEVGVRFR